MLWQKTKIHIGWRKPFRKNKGKLHRKLHVKKGRKIPASKLAKASHSRDPQERKEAALAKAGKKASRKRGTKR